MQVVQSDATMRDVVHQADPYTAELSRVSKCNGSAAVAAASAVATLAAPADGKTNYIEGFRVTGMGATAAGQVSVVVSGLLGGSLTFIQPVPAGAGVALAGLDITFPHPLPASAPDTAIVVTVPSLGAGNLAAACAAYGFAA